MSDNGTVRDTAETVKGIVEAVPIYQDLLQPATQEVGKALQTVAKTVHIALAPISAAIWGYDQVKDFIERILAEKLKNVPPERIVTPPPNVAGPALEALKYSGHDEVLREMYANLLATALDGDTVREAHPAFVKIIEQLTRDEILLLNRVAEEGRRRSPLIDIGMKTKGSRGHTVVYYRLSLLGEEAKCHHPDLTPSYLDNLQRLGLIQMPAGTKYTAEGAYDILEQHQILKGFRDAIEALKNKELKLSYYLARPTPLGSMFIKACGTRQNH